MSPTQTLVAPAILRDPTGLASLAAEIRGMALRPGDHDYDKARKAWNGMINRRPAVIVWGEFDRETQAFGLATTGGIVTHTGIAD